MYVFNGRNIMKLLSYLLAALSPGLTNYSPGPGGQTLANDIELHIRSEVLRIAQRQLVAYQFGQALRIEKNTGITYTATRYERLPLPFAPLAEGVAAAGESITIAQVSASAQQWGDLVRVTDVADMTIKHPLFKQAIRLIAIQQPETVERNVFGILMTGTQVNYANSKATRALVLATDVMSPVEIGKIVGALETFGAPQYHGDERTDMKLDADRYQKTKSPSVSPHYVALTHPLVTQDLRQNVTIATAWSYSDLNKLYNNDLGEWGGVRFCKSNMVPYWTGVALVTGTPSVNGGALATASYYIQVTGSPTATSVEQKIYQVSGALSTTGPSGSISVTLPTLAGYVFSVYIGTSTSPTNLALSSSGPSTGPLAGQATQLPSGATVILSGIGTAQTPTAAPGTGVTVYPTFFFGTDAYGQVLLDDVKYSYLSSADKSDPMNQTRVVSWKMMYGTIILNNAYMARVESGSAFSPSYTSGTATE
jgi:N4-gp56 family major capsid protein